MSRINYEAARRRMVEGQIVARGITSPRVLEAFLDVPRHLFVPANQQVYAYQDGPLPIGLGQTISQPYIVAYMTDKLALKGDERVLEIGTGSGYQSAILSQLAGEIHSIERHPQLADLAQKLLRDLGCDNVTVHVGDGTHGLVDYAPFQAVIVTAAGPEVPSPLLDQLDEGGRLIMPVGGRGGQLLKLFRRVEGEIQHEDLSPVAFVPLIGDHGWSGD
ncbi:MAG: protein-L-isoaspartate(D-aspartate) O-methyltransferase [Anaerolineales bacterium]